MNDHVLAEISVEPGGPTKRHEDLIHNAVNALRTPGIDVTVGAMSTIVEGPLDDVLAAAGRAHRAAESAERVITSIRIEGKPGGVHLRERQAETAGLVVPSGPSAQ
jgi:uncharacterized protein YqgV (UPF0045/DUF77 family)